MAMEERPCSFFEPTAVFVETNLGDHLALIASRLDTVSDLKKKIEAEFLLCFPDIGEVKVEALKVKREGKYYCLADSLPVNAFCEVKGSWFVGVDVRPLKERVAGSGSLVAPDCENAVGCGCRVKPIEYRDERDTNGCVERVDQLSLCVVEKGDGIGEEERSGSLLVRGVGGNLMFGVENEEGRRELGDRETELYVKRNCDIEETSQRAEKDNVSLMGHGKTNECDAALLEHQPCRPAKENSSRLGQFVLSGVGEETVAKTNTPAEFEVDQGNVLLQEAAPEHPVPEKFVLNNNDDNFQNSQLREAEDNMRDGVANKGERVSAQGVLETGSHQNSKQIKKKRKRVEENDASTLGNCKTKSVFDPVISESWVANAVAGALHDVKGRAKSVVEGPSISASSDISTRSRHKVHQVGVFPVGVDTRGELVMCEKNESRNKLSNANFSEDVEDASNSDSTFLAKKKYKNDKYKIDAMSMKENNSIVSGNGESTPKPQLASEVIRSDPNSKSFTFEPSSNEDPKGLHSQSNVIAHNKKKRRKKTMDAGGIDLFKEPAAPVPEIMVFENHTFSGKDCNLSLEGSDHTAKRMGSLKDEHTDNVEENHYLSNKESDDREKFDQHNKEDKIESLRKSGVIDDSGYGAKYEHDIVMSENVIETGSHKKTKRKVKRRHKRAEEGDASLHENDKKGAKEYVAVPISSVENAAVDVGDDHAIDGHYIMNEESVKREKIHMNSSKDGFESMQICGNEGDLRNEVEYEHDGATREGGLETGSCKKNKRKVPKGNIKNGEGAGSLGKENKVLGDNQYQGVERNTVEDAIQPWHNEETDETFKPVKAPVIMNSGKLSKKTRKSKDKNDANGAPASGADAEHPGIDVTPSQHLKVVNDDLSVDVGNKDNNWPHENGKIASKMDAVVPLGHKALDSAPVMENIRDSIVVEEGKSKKKTKKNKSLGAKDVAESIAAMGKDNLQGQALSINDNRDMGYSSEKAMQIDQNDASGGSRLNRSDLVCQGVEDNPLEACHRNEASSDKEASSRSGGINFHEYFGCSQGLDKAVSGEATADATGQVKQTYSHQTKADKVKKTRPSEKVNKQQPRLEDRVESVKGSPKLLSTSNAGEVVDSSQLERRVHEKPGTLLKDNRDGSSANEDSPDISDSSTRTPSDYSRSSDYSDGESYTVNSMERGSTKDGGRKSKKAIMSAMSLNEILRSSRSYKKAKINASQTLLEDTESLPLDLVPDSCPGL